MRIIFETPDKAFRIIEVIDDCSTFEDLCGDCYNPEVNHDIDPEVLARDLRKFKRQWENEGVFGYVLENWNPMPGCGYETVDSCFGFVGSYQSDAEGYDHYIVSEMLETIKKDEVSKGILTLLNP